MYDILIIGAGAVGSILARELSRYKLNILVIDKENDVGNVTSMANSAIIHSGYDPLPNSLKAKLNVLGNKKFDKLSEELDFYFFRNGSMTLAFSLEEMEALKDLEKRAKENGVNVKILNKEETLKLEPNVNKNVFGSLLASSSGIVDPFNYVVHAMENAVDNGVSLVLNEEVTDIKKEENKFIIYTKAKNKYETKLVINAAGLGSYKIANLLYKTEWEIIPRKGEYFVLEHFSYDFVKHTLFPLPSKKGKGILISPTTSFNYIVGPSAETCEEDDLSCDTLTLSNIKENALNMVPNIPFNNVIRIFAGIRATPSTHDFIFEEKVDGFITLGGIESPGLASSPAIADYVIDNFIKKHFKLENNPSFNPLVRKYKHYYGSTKEQIEEYIKEDKDYGVLVCNCENITLGEIRDCLNRSIPPRTIKAMKKRCRAGMGKCQGGFCSSRVLEEIASYFNIEKTEVLYDKNGSYILKEKIKDIDDDK